MALLNFLRTWIEIVDFNLVLKKMSRASLSELSVSYSNSKKRKKSFYFRTFSVFVQYAPFFRMQVNPIKVDTKV